MNTSKNIQLGMHIQKNRGFTLLEALIGFLILSIGMLGIASLQAISLKAGKTSVYNSVAMMKVDELFESMRANHSADALAEYATSGAGPGANISCGAGGCSGVQLAQKDVFWWLQNLKASLPNRVTTTTTVTTTPIAVSKMVIASVTINWEERNKDSEVAAAKSYTATTNICTENPC